MEHTQNDPESKKIHEQLENAKVVEPNPVIQKNTLMGVLSYIGPLVIISYFAAKDNPFVKFHIKQGLVLLSIGVCIWLLEYILSSLGMIWDAANLVVIVLSILGIINVIQGKQKSLPFVGGWSKYFII